MSAVTTDIGLLHSQLPELSLRDIAAAASEQAVQGHINAAFAALQERLNSGVGMLCQQLATQQPGTPQQPVDSVNQLCEPRRMAFLCEFVGSDARWSLVATK
jgi:hypothetical protein